jgi:predicted  nucleic acid-binding Zn-ribbon protein
MSAEKAFEQLKRAAIEVKAMLIDIDENIHPSVNEIDKLNTKVNDLSEQIAIYKYLKSQKELSPSFNLHLKVMENTVDAKHEAAETLKDEISLRSETITQTIMEVKKIELSLNDKFRIINELFKQSTTECNLAIEQLNNITNLEDSQAYLQELKKLYFWKDEEEMYKRLFQLNQKRFS